MLSGVFIHVFCCRFFFLGAYFSMNLVHHLIVGVPASICQYQTIFSPLFGSGFWPIPSLPAFHQLCRLTAYTLTPSTVNDAHHTLSLRNSPISSRLPYPKVPWGPIPIRFEGHTRRRTIDIYGPHGVPVSYPVNHSQSGLVQRTFVMHVPPS